MELKKVLKNRAGKGESMIWLTGMGLALGLVMVIGLLLLIVKNGLETFWPRPVAEIVFEDNKPIQWGEVILEREKADLSIKKDRIIYKEIQIFRGNKDQFGEAFAFFNISDIKEYKYPQDVAMIERKEYGDAVGIPLRIELHDGKTVFYRDPLFNDTFQNLIEEVANRWDEIESIEKSQIGSINRDLEALRIEEKSLGRSDLEELNEIKKEQKELKDRYEILAKKASELRQKQKVDFLFLKLSDGREMKLALGQVIHSYYPNQLGFFGRTALFLHNMWSFLIDDPREANTEGGIFPAIFGTFVMTLLMCIMVTPFGVLAAIYLREYAKQGLWLRMVRISVNNLAGVPSIVFGVFGLGFFVYAVGGTIDSVFFSDRLPTPTFGTGGLLWSSLTLALLAVPVVIVATEEALAAVSRGMREASLACGASKWQTIYRVALPAAAPGILTGMILAMARGAGEVAPLMLVGVVKLAPTLPINGIFPYIHLDQKFMHLGFHIFDLGFQSPDAEAAKPMVFATTLFLIVLVVVLNLGAIYIREKLRRKYVSGAF